MRESRLMSKKGVNLYLIFNRSISCQVTVSFFISIL